ncbi:P-loop containing nucleoside triphosphate hydrolase protein, partial [Morchella snyderi]
VIFLTATPPPDLLREFEASALIKNLKLIRASTNRKNMKYEVFKDRRNNILPIVKMIVGDMVVDGNRINDRNSGNKILIYTRTKNVCKVLGKELKCGIYHSESPGKDSSLREWIEDEKNILVATTALGAGVDFANIRLVIFAGTPHTFVDFAQGSGHGGRDWMPCRTVLVYADDEPGKASDE